MHDHTHEHHHHEQHIDPAHLLEHMYEHNVSHTNELKGVADTLSGEAKDLVLKAAACYEEGNAALQKALDAMKEA